MLCLKKNIPRCDSQLFVFQHVVLKRFRTYRYVFNCFETFKHYAFDYVSKTNWITHSVCFCKPKYMVTTSNGIAAGGLDFCRCPGLPNKLNWISCVGFHKILKLQVCWIFAFEKCLGYIKRIGFHKRVGLQVCWISACVRITVWKRQKLYVFSNGRETPLMRIRRLKSNLVHLCVIVDFI